MPKKGEGQKEAALLQQTPPTIKVPNVRLAAEARPLGAGPVTVGEQVLCQLPSEAEQRAGFYCEAAERLVQLYPGRFKLIQQLGEES